MHGSDVIILPPDPPEQQKDFHRHCPFEAGGGRIGFITRCAMLTGGRVHESAKSYGAGTLRTDGAVLAQTAPGSSLWFISRFVAWGETQQQVWQRLGIAETEACDRVRQWLKDQAAANAMEDRWPTNTLRSDETGAMIIKLPPLMPGQQKDYHHHYPFSADRLAFVLQRPVDPSSPPNPAVRTYGACPLRYDGALLVQADDSELPCWWFIVRFSVHVQSMTQLPLLMDRAERDAADVVRRWIDRRQGRVLALDLHELTKRGKHTLPLISDQQAKATAMESVEGARPAEAPTQQDQADRWTTDTDVVWPKRKPLPGIKTPTDLLRDAMRQVQPTIHVYFELEGRPARIEVPEDRPSFLWVYEITDTIDPETGVRTYTRYYARMCTDAGQLLRLAAEIQVPENGHQARALAGFVAYHALRTDRRFKELVLVLGWSYERSAPEIRICL